MMSSPRHEEEAVTNTVCGLDRYFGIKTQNSFKVDNHVTFIDYLEPVFGQNQSANLL